MQKYKVEITDSAKSDMREIFSYICFQLKELSIAEKLMYKIESAIESLSFMPEKYHLYPNEPWHSQGLHYFTVGNYAIFYVVDNDNLVVSVLHVYYAKSDLDERLKNTEC